MFTAEARMFSYGSRSGLIRMFRSDPDPVSKKRSASVLKHGLNQIRNSGARDNRGKIDPLYLYLWIRDPVPFSGQLLPDQQPYFFIPRLGFTV